MEALRLRPCTVHTAPDSSLKLVNAEAVNSPTARQPCTGGDQGFPGDSPQIHTQSAPANRVLLFLLLTNLVPPPLKHTLPSVGTEPRAQKDSTTSPFQPV